jgi:predicted transcriptional regulator
MDDNSERLRELVSDVAAAYFSNSSVAPAEVSNVLAQITASLSAIGGPREARPAPAGPAKPSAADIAASIRPDGLVSFEDGRVYKTLRRHLNRLGVTPNQYREKWGLPAGYPLVAPSLSELRSTMARQKQLGRANIEPPRGSGRRKNGSATPKAISTR